RRLRAAAPPEAMVARWGSDEFAVLVSDAGTAGEIVDLAERLADQIAAEPFDLAGKPIAVTASVGVAVGAAEPRRGDGPPAPPPAVLASGDAPPDPPAVLARGDDSSESPAVRVTDVLGGAQVAVSKAKEAGRGRVEVFAAEMHTAVRRRAELVTALRAAVSKQ